MKARTRKTYFIEVRRRRAVAYPSRGQDRYECIQYARLAAAWADYCARDR
jgi:hypothetical protein